MANNGIVTLQTDLKSLKYPSVPLGSAKPYVSKDIGEAPSTQTGLEITSRIDDTSRIAQMLIDKPGIKYLLHEAQLQQIGVGQRIKKAQQGRKSLVRAVLGQIGSTIVTTAKIAGSTLAQVPVNGTGTHFLKGFRTDTYLQDGGNHSAFASFFGAGGVEGAQYALRGEVVPGQHESDILGKSSKYDYIKGEVLTDRNETLNTPLPKDVDRQQNKLNAQAGSAIPVYSASAAGIRDTSVNYFYPPSVPTRPDSGWFTGSQDNFYDIKQRNDSEITYTGYSTEDNIRAALNNKIVRIDKNGDAYRETQADWPTNGGVGVDETTNQNTNKTVSYGTKGEASIPKPKQLNVLAREINTGSVTPVSRDGSNIPYVAKLQDFRSGSLSSYAYNYNLTTVHKEHRIGLGNQGRAGKNRTNYMITHELDRDSVNYQSDTTSRKDGAATDSVRDLAKFFFEIITPDAPSTYLYFRAFIESIDDGYSATWNAQKYVGRAEDFYTYGGFSREISISFNIAAATRDEMKPLYRKMVYLASATAPTYGNIGLMRGTLARLTVGSYLSEIPGVITSVKYTLDNTMPWEIAMSNPDGGGGTRADDDQQELPMMLKCSVSFKPIHDFAPQTGLYHYFTAPQENLRNGAVAFFTPPAAKAFAPDAPLPADKENGVPPGQSTTQVKADTNAYNKVMENTFKPGWVTKPNPYGP